MAWSSHTLRQAFQVLVNQLVSFHDECGKNKNQEDFLNLRTACEAGLDFVYKNNMPNGAETIVASISGGIYTALSQIGAKKEGGEGNLEFHENLIKAAQACALFRNACENEIRNPVLISPELISVVSNGDETHISFGRSMFNLLTVEELNQKIQSLSDLPQQNYSCLSFFKRPAKHYPRLTAGSVITGLSGAGYGLLTAFSHYVGPSLDILLHADQTGFTHQALIASTLLLSSIALFSTAAYCTSVNYPQENEVAPDMSTALLRRV